MDFKRSEYPERSWSLSKYNIFKQCKRKYYYSTYAHWNGWEDNCSPETRKAYILGKLQDVYSLSGILIHKYIRNAFKFKIKDPNYIYDAIIRELRSACENSLKDVVRWRKQPKNFTMLHEYYYGNGISEVLADEVKDRINKCCNNFYKSMSYSDIIDKNSKIYELDEDEYTFFFFNGIKVYAKLDIFYEYLNQLTIVDWKTGSADSDNHKLQMLIYYLYIEQKFKNNKIDFVKCIDEYLLVGQRFTEILNHKDINEIGIFINESIQEINSYLQDIELNKPKNIDSFPKCRSALCTKCNYIELCQG